MSKKDLLFRNPLGALGIGCAEGVSPGGFGAVVARAGVGKTALLVQLALSCMLNQKNVLHISLRDPIQKVGLWYEEVFHRIAQQLNDPSLPQIWAESLPHRFIMTFQVERFSMPILEERLTDLIEQGIFRPQMIMIDGFPFEKSAKETLEAIQRFASKLSVPVWFTVRSHRHEKPDAQGMPVQLSDIAEFFEVIFQLVPEGPEIHVRALKKENKMSEAPIAVLDPATMLAVQK